MNIFTSLGFRRKKTSEPKIVISDLPNGRVSSDNDTSTLASLISGANKLVTPSFKPEIIPLIRNLYKVNPDVGIAVQDMFKLTNTGHSISFPQNSDSEVKAMKLHLNRVTREWSRYTAGINGLVTKMVVQTLVGGAISVEAVPKADLSGISTILFLKPEEIKFERENNGVYQPYQIVKQSVGKPLQNYVKLNNYTYFYIGLFNDTDEPYGIPPFMPSLDSLDGQAVMKENFKHIMKQAGMLGFLEATIEKSSKKSSESDLSYAKRLSQELTQFKEAIKTGLADGVIVGNNDDHQFKFNSTSKDMANLDKPWTMNQQSVANGLGVNGNLIGISSANTEGGAGIMLSKMISQLRSMHMLLSFVLEKIYELELILAGFNPKTIKVEFRTSTISDELKTQQGEEIKIRNLTALYMQGIISQEDYAWRMGIDSPDVKEPREDPTEFLKTNKSKGDREKSKDKSDRTVRDKVKINPKRKDQDTKER